MPRNSVVLTCRDAHASEREKRALFPDRTLNGHRVFPSMKALREREFFIEKSLVRIILMIRWTALATWESKYPLLGSLKSTFLKGHQGLGRHVASGSFRRHVSRVRFSSVVKWNSYLLPGVVRLECERQPCLSHRKYL